MTFTVGCGKSIRVISKNEWKIGWRDVDFDPAMLGQHARHLSRHVVPLRLALEIVEDHEAAFEQVRSQVIGALTRDRPEAGLRNVEDRIVKDAVVFEIEDVAAPKARPHRA